MNKEELQLMINQFYDGELSKEFEPILFNRLSKDEVSREYFKKLNLIRNALDHLEKEFPIELEERILYSVDQKIQKESRVFPGFKSIYSAASYVFTFILLILSIFFYSQSSDYEKKWSNQIFKLISKVS